LVAVLSSTIFILKKVTEIQPERGGVSYANARKKGSRMPFRLA
jgi:hypothetical protein